MREEINREVPREYVCDVYLRNSMKLFAAGKFYLDFSRDICLAFEGFSTCRVTRDNIRDFQNYCRF